MGGLILLALFDNLHLSMSLCISSFLETRFLWGKACDDAGY